MIKEGFSDGGSVENILMALDQIENDLPSLVGEKGWLKISKPFKEKLKQLRNSGEKKEQALLSTELIAMLWPYSGAIECLHAARHSTDLYWNLMTNFASLAVTLGLDTRIAQQLTEAASQSQALKRMVMVKPGGIGKTKTIKIKNLEFDFGEIGGLAGGIILTAMDIIGEKNYLFMAAGIVIIAASLYKAISVEISEQEATVFWGFIQACDVKKEADEVKILKHTNAERKKFSLESLTKDKVKYSLLKLSSLNSVKAVEGKPDKWRIIEKYRIKKS